MKGEGYTLIKSHGFFPGESMLSTFFIFLTEKSNIIFFETACMLCYVVLSNFGKENNSINFSFSTDNSIQIVCYYAVIAYNYSITYKHNIQHTNFQRLK